MGDTHDISLHSDTHGCKRFECLIVGLWPFVFAEICAHAADNGREKGLIVSESHRSVTPLKSGRLVVADGHSVPALLASTLSLHFSWR